MTKPIQGVSCEVCGQQRDPGTIHKKQSNLLKNINLLVCDKCTREQKEPRAFVILMIKRSGLPSVKDYIENHRYPGPKIEIDEII